MRQRADIGGRAADVDDHRVLETGEEGRAAHRVGRTGGEGQHRVLLGEVGAHQRAVVLGDVERRRDAQVGDRLPESGDRLPRQWPQAGVEDRGILALEQPDAADVAGERDVRAGNLLLQMMAAASCSMLVLTGEKTEETAMAVIPLPAISSATARISSGSSGEISRPSNSWPPWQR